MKPRWEVVAGLFVAALVLVPLATAGAQVPPTAGDPVTEDTLPPSGTVTCTTAPTLTPDHGPPGTVVTVTASFQGNCDEFSGLAASVECTGAVTGDFAGLTFPFSFADIAEPAGTGQFVAPVIEPTPPVADAIEALAVTVTCVVAVCGPPGSAGECAAPVEGLPTAYVYPSVDFDLELFADQGEQPTLVEDDQAVDSGVVSATPPFTG